MKLPWFKRMSIFFVPVSAIGWLLFLCALAYAVYACIELNNRSHSVSDFFINVLFSLLIIAAVYSLIAYLTMKVKKPL